MSDLTLLDHIISQTKQNVGLLMSHNRISQSDGRDILAKLSSTGAGSIASLTQQTQRLRMSPAPTQSVTSNSANSHAASRSEARVMWEWTGEDPNDLSLYVGEIIEIVNETNADWWRGRNKAGKEGLFPSLYVEKLPPRSVSPLSSFPEFPKSKTSSDSNLKYGLTEPKYPSPPGPPQYSSPQQYPPPPGPPPTGGYMPPPVPAYHNSYPVNPPVAQPVPQQPPKKGRFGGLGATMAQSAAGGLGFGAGAAIGSDVINSIF